MQIHRARMHLVRRLAGIDRTHHPARRRLHNRDLPARTPHAHHPMRVRLPRRHRRIISPRPPPQPPVRHQPVHHLPRLKPCDLPIRQRRLQCRAQNMAGKNVGIGGIKHRRLHRPADERIRVMHQIRIQRIRAGNKHHRGGLIPPPGTPRLLPKTRKSSRKPGRNHRIQTPNVNTQLQGIGGGNPQ